MQHPMIYRGWEIRDDCTVSHVHWVAWNGSRTIKGDLNADQDLCWLLGRIDESEDVPPTTAPGEREMKARVIFRIEAAGDHHLRHLAVAKACADAGVYLPVSVAKYFNVNLQDAAGAVEAPRGSQEVPGTWAHSLYNSSREGKEVSLGECVEVLVSDIPPGTVKIRFLSDG